MQKHIFITGPSGCGKTTLIRAVMGDKLAEAGGFITERIQDESGNTCGYDLFPAAAAIVDGFEGERFLTYSSSSSKADNEVFRSLGVRLLQEATYYPYAMLDEFGGFELIIPQFREALLDILNNDALPCIGVIKGKDNSRHIRKALGLGDKYTAYYNALLSALNNDPDTLLLELTRFNRKKVEETVRHWAEEFVL